MRRLRLQLILVLVLVALLPAIPAVWTANALFRETLDPLLEAELVSGTQAGLESTRALLQSEFAAFEARIFGGAQVDTLNEAFIGTLSEKERSSLLALEALRSDIRSRNGVRLLQPPQRVTLHQRETMVARVERVDAADPPVWVRGDLPQSLTARAESVSQALRRLETFRRERESVYRSLLAAFSLVYGLILALVLALGLFVASRLTRPMASLGQGIDRVSAGHLDVSVPLSGSGDVRGLLERFNEMVHRLREQRDELRRLEKLTAWRRMAKSLAHEIKNPLTPIQLAAQQLRDSFVAPTPSADGTLAGSSLEPLREFKVLLDESTGIIEEEVGALRNLVNEFSQFARLPEPQMERVAVHSMLSDLVQLYGADRVHLVESAADAEPGGPYVWGDRGQLHRAVLNLVSNALDAQRPEAGRTGARGGEVPIELRCRTSGPAGRLVEVDVRDHGPGVPESDLERVFEPDYTTKSDGMGLGLAIVEATITHHHGTVTVRNHPEGGAVFTIALPAAAEGVSSR